VPRVLLDTDILSEILKGIDARVAAKAAEYLREHGAFTLSAVTVMEVVKGLHRVGSERRLGQFLAEVRRHEVLPFDTESAELAGRVYGSLERAGQPIGRADPQIAAIALRHGLPLVTGNVGHYSRVQDLGYPLQIDNWRE
jgi:tRNA(fMet)-specific endonuclease VapC